MDTTMHDSVRPSTGEASREGIVVPDVVPAVAANQFTRILSLEDGHYFIPEADRHLMCLRATRDGKKAELLVSRTDRTNVKVMRYEGILETHELDFDVQAVMGNEVLDAYLVGGEMVLTDRDEGRTIHLVTEYIREAIALGASDIHSTIDDGRWTLEYRILSDLEIHDTGSEEKGWEFAGAIYQWMTDISEPMLKKLQAQPARVAPHYVDALGLSSIRVNTLPLDRGHGTFLRLFDKGHGNRSLKDLGFFPEQIEIWEDLAYQPHGIMLMAGPTGSGKSTTIRALLSKMIADNSRRNYIAVEDPPEAPIPGVKHTPVNAGRVSLEAQIAAWSNRLGDLMRCDPDVIFLGEIRDSATASLAVRAAQTGHLMLSTVHGNDPLGALERLENEGVKRSFLLDESLFLALSNQSLLTVLCPKCKVDASELRGDVFDSKFTKLQLRRLEKVIDPRSTFLQGKGCGFCGGRGGIDRTVAGTILRTSGDILRAFDKGDKTEAYGLWIDQGGITKRDAAIRKIKQGIVDPRTTEKIVGNLDVEKHLWRSERE